MKVGEIMRTPVVVIQETTSLEESEKAESEARANAFDESLNDRRAEHASN
jgi:hypothetical protein